MIIYSPLDGEALTSAVRSRPRHCFLMTQLGGDIPEGIQIIRAAVTRICQEADYGVIDARTQVTGGDFLLKIWETHRVDTVLRGRRTRTDSILHTTQYLL